ncbi:hypothetical protein RJO15_19655 [Herbaspirillum huttiense F1]|uniref:hypothetical protein n=1 Tax=Herbaspirillum huttiense TaxID=863372 RepID=UPI0028886DA2|nr:hypothetical protein [Herbaspirillum huttiense]MDT0358013.1 hypothetical protein [Herbaspirillum huttiense F1]
MSSAVNSTSAGTGAEKTGASQRGKMLYAHKHDIASRHLIVLAGLAEMSQKGEIVSDLVRTVVRRCLVTMQAAGADVADIRRIFGSALSNHATVWDNCNLSKDSVFKIAEQFLELLLFFEEQKAFFDSNHLSGSVYDQVRH